VRVLERNRPDWELAQDAVTGRSALIVYTPIVQNDGRLLGVLQTSADLVDLARQSGVLSSRLQATAIVIDRDGRVILHSDPAVTQARPVVDIPSPAGSDPPAGNGRPMTVRPLVGISPVPGTNWVAVVDSLDQGAPSGGGPWLALALGALLTAVLDVFAAVVLARSLTRPLAALTQAARSLAAGDSAAPLPRDSGQPEELKDLVAAFATMRAELANAVDRLYASEERYRRLAENVPDLMTHYELDPALTFTYVSPSATEITGYTPDEFYADSALGYQIIHPEDRPKLDAIAVALADGSVAPNHQVLRCVRKDGRMIWVEQHMTPVFKGDRLVAVEGITRDVTERIALSQAVERERAVLSAILTSMHDGILLFDEAQCLSYSNAYASQLLRLDLATFIGKGPRDIFEAFRPGLREPDLYWQLWEYALTVLATSPAFEVETTDRTGGHLLVQALPVVGAGHPDHGMVIILRDVTDVKRLVRMEERERIAMDLHDGVIQRLYALSLGLGAQARDQAPNGVAAEAPLRNAIAAISEAIVDIRGQVLILRQPQGDLRTQLEHVLEVVRAGASLKTELIVDRHADRLLDPETTVQVIFCVWEAASNAVRHANAANLVVECQHVGELVVVTIRDDGIGFDPEAQAQRPGHGLSNLAARARTIGAALSISSRPGAGTNVRLDLPIATGGLRT
jgi:PAS domain S-box-containing protein